MRRITNEEAIEVLEDMKVKVEIPKAAVTQYKRNVALDMAIKSLELFGNSEQLPPVQPESCTNMECPYCREDSDGYVKPLEKNCHAFIRFGMNGWEINLSAKGWHGSAKVMYCPMCGRRLKNDK